jgi:EAL domain-containing protein (putative c-di-GMP-specific phosphodiesterase class I)
MLREHPPELPARGEDRRRRRQRLGQVLAPARAVVDLSQTFHFRVVAEGVETTEQLDQQRRLGCHGAQGYLIGRPKPAYVFGELLSTRPMFEALAKLSA